MKKVILNKNGEYIGHAIVEDSNEQEMVNIYKQNYNIFEPYEKIDELNKPTGIFIYPEHSVQIIDITQEYNQQKINEESLKYLTDTDWYIIREYDTGIICPVEIKKLRAEARSKIVK